MSYNFRNACLKVSIGAAFLLTGQFATAQLDTAAIGDIVAAKAAAVKSEAILVVASRDSIIYQRDSRSFSAARAKAPAGYISQWFTTALLLQFVDEGKLSLEDKISQYLPEYGRYGKGYITIRNCLTHYTGIRFEPALFAKNKKSSLEEEVNSYAAREIYANPGEEARYTDRGFLIVARILEVITKKKFEMLAQQKLFRPAGMRNTSFNTLDGSQPNPAFGAITTAGDLAIFGQMLLQEGKAKGVAVLSKESVSVLRQVQVEGASIKHNIKPLLHTDLALGVWAPEASDKKANLLLQPSHGGSSLSVDFCRGYVTAYLLKQSNTNPKADAYSELKEALDPNFGSNCK